MGDTNIDLAKVVEMLELFDVRGEHSQETDSPLPKGRKGNNKNNKTATDKSKIDSMSTAIKSLVHVVKGLAEKVEAFEKIAVEVSVKDKLIEELQTKIATLEQKSETEKDDLEKRIKESENALEGLQNRHNDDSSQII